MKQHTYRFETGAHCMMGRGRTHHHVAKQKSEDQSRRPIIAMDYFFMRMERSLSVQAISEESITCIAVKEDRHQNEEPWTIERVVKFIDLLGYREITLKNDTEPAIIAFRNRVAEACKAEVTTEDAVKGDKESNGLIENAVMLIRGIIRTIKCHIGSRTQEPLSDDSLVMPWLVEHAGCILSKCQKGRDGRTPFERLHGKKPTQEFVPFGEKVLARQVTTEPRNRMKKMPCSIHGNTHFPERNAQLSTSALWNCSVSIVSWLWVRSRVQNSDFRFFKDSWKRIGHLERQGALPTFKTQGKSCVEHLEPFSNCCSHNPFSTSVFIEKTRSACWGYFGSASDSPGRGCGSARRANSGDHHAGRGAADRSKCRTWFLRLPSELRRFGCQCHRS